MPRRKKGRDKPKSSKRRQREPKNLFTLNVEAFQKIGDPKPIISKLNGDELRARWEQRVPAYAGGSFEDAVVVSHLLKPRRIELDEVDLEQLDRQPEKVRRRRARQMLQLDAYNLVFLGSGLKEYQQYKGAKDYVERDGFWYLQLVSLNIEIAQFETESKAREWAWEYLGEA